MYVGKSAFLYLRTMYQKSTFYLCVPNQAPLIRMCTKKITFSYAYNVKSTFYMQVQNDIECV